MQPVYHNRLVWHSLPCQLSRCWLGRIGRSRSISNFLKELFLHIGRPSSTTQHEQEETQHVQPAQHRPDELDSALSRHKCFLTSPTCRRCRPHRSRAGHTCWPRRWLVGRVGGDRWWWVTVSLRTRERFHRWVRLDLCPSKRVLSDRAASLEFGLQDMEFRLQGLSIRPARR